MNSHARKARQAGSGAKGASRKCNRCFDGKFKVHLLRPPSSNSPNDYHLGHEVLDTALSQGNGQDSFWICSAYLTGEAFRWLRQYFYQNNKQKRKTLYLISRAEHDPLQKTGRNVKQWIANFCGDTRAAVYLSIPARGKGEEPLMHAKLYLDIQFPSRDPDGNLADAKEDAAKAVSAFFGSMNFTNTGLGVNSTRQQAQHDQHFELLAEVLSQTEKDGLAGAFRYLWNRGGRKRYKFLLDQQTKNTVDILHWKLTSQSWNWSPPRSLRKCTKNCGNWYAGRRCRRYH